METGYYQVHMLEPLPRGPRANIIKLFSARSKHLSSISYFKALTWQVGIMSSVFVTVLPAQSTFNIFLFDACISAGCESAAFLQMKYKVKIPVV